MKLVYWSVSYLSKIFFLEVDLIRKRFQIYGIFNILSLFFVSFGLLIAGKFFLAMGNYFQLVPIISLFLLLIGQCDVAVSTEKLFKTSSSLRAFFPFLNISTTKHYFTYRKILLSTLLTFYFLVPLNFTYISFKYCFLFMIILSFFTLQISISTLYLSNRKKEMVSTIIKAIYCIILALSIRGMLPAVITNIMQHAMNMNFSSLILIYVFLLILNWWILSPRKGS